MEQELQQAQEIYNLMVEFMVNYSFQIVGAIIIVLLGMFVGKKVSGLIENLMVRKNRDVTLSHFAAGFVKILIVAMTAIIALGKIGISVTPFVAAIGAVSLGAGLALQGLLSNYGDSSIDIGMRYWVPTASLFDTNYRANLAVFKALAENNIEIPFPQRHVHLINQGE